LIPQDRRTSVQFLTWLFLSGNNSRGADDVIENRGEDTSDWTYRGRLFVTRIPREIVVQVPVREDTWPEVQLRLDVLGHALVSGGFKKNHIAPGAILYLVPIEEHREYGLTGEWRVKRVKLP